MADLYLSLIHFPVLDRNGRIVTSAITSLDLHDLARSSRTYGVRAMYVVHPIAEQRQFALRVMDHWRLSEGRLYDSRRREALDLVEVVDTLEDARKAAEILSGIRPRLVHTSARTTDGVSYAEMRAWREADGPPLMLMIGTGFGLAPSMRERADLVLGPIRGPGEYNHLSVRAAASIILDRLCGR